VSTEPAAEDGRSVHYRLTEKGIALAPVLLDLLIWAARHEETAAPCAFITQMEQNREAVLAETYRRWAERDTMPLIPPFKTPVTSAGNTAEARAIVKARRLPKERLPVSKTQRTQSSLKGKPKR
jgi:hypothetical protein